ncbi:MAG: hypothetical protein ACLGJB_11460 [Blastocatellia bacterium]
MRLAIGDYEKANRTSSKTRARYLFLKAIDICEPRVLSDLLEGEPSQLFSRLPAEIGQGLTCSSLTQSPCTLPLARALVNWAKKWHLKEDWFIDQAIHVLQLWAWSPPPEEEIDVDWASPVSLATITTDEEMRFSFEHRGGDLAIQTRSEIKNDIRKAFDKKLESYLERMKALANERGYLSALKKYKFTHFEMLARYQVQGWTHKRIAAEYDYNDSISVAHIIPKIAEFIGLTLREGRGKRGKDTKPRTRRSPRST